MKLFKKTLVVLSSVAVLLSSGIIAPVAVANAEEEVAATTTSAPDPLANVTAEAVMIVDATTGQVVYEKNADTPMPVASMSKMMSEYLILEAIEEGTLTWDQEILIDEYVHNLSKAPDVSNIGLTQGETYTVEELFSAVAVYSACGATVALAQAVAGTEAEFVNMMNAKAEEMGLTNTTFVNSTGLSNADLVPLGQLPAGGPEDENIMSARDVATLAYNLINDYPEILEFSSISKLEFSDGKTYPNFNWMLPGLIYEYEGVDGLKTGTTDAAGACFACTCEKDGQRYITVVMNSTDKNTRFEDTTKVLDYAYNTFSMQTVFTAGTEVGDAGVNNGKEETVKVELKNDVELLVKDGADLAAYTFEFVPNEEAFGEDGKLEAPIEAGTSVGYVTIIDDQGNPVTSVDQSSMNTTLEVVTSTGVEEANIFQKTFRKIKGIFE